MNLTAPQTWRVRDWHVARSEALHFWDGCSLEVGMEGFLNFSLFQNSDAHWEWKAMSCKVGESVKRTSGVAPDRAAARRDLSNAIYDLTHEVLL